MTTTPEALTEAETLCIVDVAVVGHACQDCAVLIANADHTGMDDERAATATATLDAIVADEGGPALILEIGADSTMFRCTICGDDVMSPAHLVGALRA